MERMHEYIELQNELAQTPPALSQTVGRALKRAKRARTIRMAVTMPISGLIILFIMFSVLINISIPFAAACEKTPILREMALALGYQPPGNQVSSVALPEQMREANIYQIDKLFTVDEQTILFKEIEITANNVRLMVTGDESNSAWPRSVQFNLINEDGQRFVLYDDGFSYRESLETCDRYYRGFWWEDALIAESQSLTMEVTGITWLDKAFEPVFLDLSQNLAKHLPKDVTLLHAIRSDDGWKLVFQQPITDEPEAGKPWAHAYEIFQYEYNDPEGNPFYINSHQLSPGYTDPSTGEYIDTPGYLNLTLSLDGYTQDSVMLLPSYTRRTSLAEPLLISIEQSAVSGAHSVNK